jgi:hypothetical protein
MTVINRYLQLVQTVFCLCMIEKQQDGTSAYGNKELASDIDAQHLYGQLLEVTIVAFDDKTCDKCLPSLDVLFSELKIFTH